MILKIPTIEDKDIYLDYYKERHGNNNINYEEFLLKLEKARKGIGLDEGISPSTLYLCIEDDKVVGTISIRHELITDDLRNWIGHIGYNIRESERGKGYAPLMLNLALEKCIELGINDVMITCLEDNLASSKTILDNAGVYTRKHKKDDKNLLVYWINAKEGLEKRDDILKKVEDKKRIRESINTIVNNNTSLFGDNPSIKNIYTESNNVIYNINDQYIIKMSKNNDKSINKEIEYYKTEKNEYMPTLYEADNTKSLVPYSYIIMEKVKGNTLFEIWDSINDDERNNIIKMICDYMKLIHIEMPYFDWSNELLIRFKDQYDKIKDNEMFNDSFINTLLYASTKFKNYLTDNRFVFTHNNLTFDHIIYDGNSIKVINYSNCKTAPIDYELNRINRMAKNPMNYAPRSIGDKLNPLNYQNILNLVYNHYTELKDIKDLDRRLDIYDLLMNMLSFNYNNSQFNFYRLIVSASKIAYKDELTFDDIKTTEDLMNYMNANISYGWLDKDKNITLDTMKGIRANYVLGSIDEIIEYGVGTCIEQTKLEKYVLDKLGYETKAFCFRKYEDQYIEENIKMHCFVFYKKDDKWYYFEHANMRLMGIREFNTLNEGLQFIIDFTGEAASERVLTEIGEIPDHLSFLEFNQYVNTFESYNMNNLKVK